MSRITLTDTILDVVTKMSDGNPGAINTMMLILKEAKNIDPQAFMDGLSVLLSLDDMGIYGTEIYILSNDQCNRDIRKLLMLLRATQLGFISRERIKKIASSQTRENLLSEKEMDLLDNKVCSELDQFSKK